MCVLIAKGFVNLLLIMATSCARVLTRQLKEDFDNVFDDNLPNSNEEDTDHESDVKLIKILPMQISLYFMSCIGSYRLMYS